MAASYLPDLANMETAEDLFALLDVGFEPEVLAAHRVAILRRFGNEVNLLERRRPPVSESERRDLYAAALARAHALWARGGSEVEPYLRPRPRNLVSAERLRRTVAPVVGT